MAKLIVCNWKMTFTHEQAASWLARELPELVTVVRTTPHRLVLCPSFTNLGALPAIESPLSWGAQSCGFALSGAYTGDVSPLSLKELGVTYTIVGHSEQRSYHGATNAQIAQQVVALHSAGITPIVCIGEHQQDRHQYETVLHEQLEQLDKACPIIIAYEPVWAIGSGVTPTYDELQQRIAFTREHGYSRVLYGGSVDPARAQEFAPLVAGYLVGRAGSDAALLKKIILSC